MSTVRAIEDRMIEKWRAAVLADLFANKNFTKSFNVWHDLILKNLDLMSGTKLPISNEDMFYKKIFDLGDHLSEIFKSTTEGRTQSGTSKSGHLWESLVTWYLNLILVGSNIIVVKKKAKLLPKVFINALTVSYMDTNGNQPASEPDLLAIQFLDTKKISDFEDKHPDFSLLKREKQARSSKDLLDFCQDYLNIGTKPEDKQISIADIQCKTNWNDNAVIPMAWDIIYRSSYGGDSGIKIGTDGINLSTLRKFSYCFVTVPTNKLESYKTDSLCVKRVSRLSGGNYWGYPKTFNIQKNGTKNKVKGVAYNIKDLPNKVFGFLCLSYLKVNIDYINRRDNIFRI